MQYRINRRTGDKISILGVGTSAFPAAVKADACIGCGHCNRRCPFHVNQVSRMREIADYFG